MLGLSFQVVYMGLLVLDYVIYYVVVLLMLFLLAVFVKCVHARNFFSLCYEKQFLFTRHHHLGPM